MISKPMQYRHSFNKSGAKWAVLQRPYSQSKFNQNQNQTLDKRNTKAALINSTEAKSKQRQIQIKPIALQNSQQ